MEARTARCRLSFFRAALFTQRVHMSVRMFASRVEQLRPTFHHTEHFVASARLRAFLLSTDTWTKLQKWLDLHLMNFAGATSFTKVIQLQPTKSFANA